MVSEDLEGGLGRPTREEKEETMARAYSDVPSDLEIAQAADIRPITEIADRLGLQRDELVFHGDQAAKVRLRVLDRLKDEPDGKYIDVTAITPTPLGEGKTVNTIGLSLGLGHIGKRVVTCIRQPSLGPTFGIKGGAAGGGYSQVVPMEDFNLHLTGDIHAVSIANNLLAAFIDNHIAKGNVLNIDPYTITWRRVVDVNDAALRNIVVGLGTENDGRPRQTGFDIAVASEVMAILALSSDLKDLRERLGRITVAYTKGRRPKPVTADDLRCAGAMAVLMKDALLPTLMQTLEHTPCFVHAGPFANIAQGNSSIIADRIALKLGEIVVTESGFGADCGMEKFFDIKCRVSRLIPNAVLMVATVRALKMHSGKYRVVPGKPIPGELLEENVADVEAGACNLAQHIENALKFGVPVVVAINRFTSDHDSEVEAIRKVAQAAGAEGVAISEVWKDGGAGGAEMAEMIWAAAQKPSRFRLLYQDDASIQEKIETIAREIYRADGVVFSPEAEKQIRRYTRSGFGNLPICMAKTHLSFTHDPSLKGTPRGWVLPVTEVRASTGAGFIFPLCGAMRTMPGLPSHPAGENVDIDENGRVVGLF